MTGLVMIRELFGLEVRVNKNKFGVCGLPLDFSGGFDQGSGHGQGRVSGRLSNDRLPIIKHPKGGVH